MKRIAIVFAIVATFTVASSRRARAECTSIAPRGDTSSRAMSLGLEIRLWLLSPSQVPCGVARRGPFIGFYLDFGYGVTRDRVDIRQFGAPLANAKNAGFGYRFVIARSLEIAPSVGYAFRTDA